jgi:putative transposase
MTLNQSALLELTQMLRTADNGDVMRQMLGFMLQALVDAEATSVIGAAPHERTEDRTTHRNGTRPKTVSTTAGDLTVKIPKLRQGSFFPTLLEPRRRVDVALHAVVMEAYVHGVSTRKVDDLVTALGVDTGISKSEVSRICAGSMSRSLPTTPVLWITARSRTCSWMRPTARPASTGGWCPRRS